MQVLGKLRFAVGGRFFVRICSSAPFHALMCGEVEPTFASGLGKGLATRQNTSSDIG
jgi:hypothetical protein